MGKRNRGRFILTMPQRRIIHIDSIRPYIAHTGLRIADCDYYRQSESEEQRENGRYLDPWREHVELKRRKKMKRAARK